MNLSHRPGRERLGQTGMGQDAKEGETTVKTEKQRRGMAMLSEKVVEECMSHFPSGTHENSAAQRCINKAYNAVWSFPAATFQVQPRRNRQKQLM